MSSWKGNICRSLQSAQDFNENRDLRFEDIYGNSAGVPFQQRIPP